MKPFAQRATSSEVSAIKRIAAMASRDPEVISLSQGIPSFSTPEHIRRVVAESLLRDEPGIGKYSVYMGNRELREVIARLLGEEFGYKVSAEENIFVSAGGMEGLLAVILALIEPNDEVILPAPDCGAHYQHVHLAWGKAVPVPLNEKKGWSWEIAELEAAITPQTKLILFTNPGNPCGNVFSRSSLTALAKIAKRYDLWVLVDETYSFLTYDRTPFIPAGTIADFRGRLVVSRSFSKEYAMTGWRLGFIYAPPEVISETLKIHDPVVIAAPTISQKAGYIALTGDQSSVSEMVRELTRRRNIFCRLLGQMRGSFSYVKPKGAYYVFTRVSPQILRSFATSTEQFAFRMLEEAKVAVVPGSEFRPSTDEFIRFSFAGEVREMEEAMARIRKWLSIKSL